MVLTPPMAIPAAVTPFKILSTFFLFIQSLLIHTNPDTWIICFLTLIHPDITIDFLFYTININSNVYLKSYFNVTKALKQTFKN